MSEPQLSIECAIQPPAYRPGEECVGKVSWSCPEPPTGAELRLIWKAVSEGPDDVGFATELRFDQPYSTESRGFRLTLPDGPYTFQGKHIELKWFLELVVEPFSTAIREELVIAPDARPLVLESLPEKGLRKWFSSRPR